MNTNSDQAFVVQPGIISAEYNFYVSIDEYAFFANFAGEPDEQGFRNVNLEIAITHPEFREWTPVFELFALTMQQLWGSTETMALPNSKHIVVVEIGSLEMGVDGLFPLIITVHPPFSNVGEIRPLIENT